MQPAQLTTKNVLNFVGSAVASAGVVMWIQKYLEYRAYLKDNDKQAAEKAAFLLKITPAMIALGALAWLAGSRIKEG